MYQLELVFQFLGPDSVLKHCGAYKHIYAQDPKTILGYPSWQALPTSWDVQMAACTLPRERQPWNQAVPNEKASV